jgi:tetratricopeptide (TPR) repeat protein
LEIDNNSLEKDYMGSIAAYLESIKEYSKAMDFYNEAIDRLLPKYGKSEYCT